jgi:hypothetical protein
VTATLLLRRKTTPAFPGGQLEALQPAETTHQIKETAS